MRTYKIDSQEPDHKAIRAAVDAIRSGELVIFPTETVYGLAADALNEEAVLKVYEAKGRPAHEPLPVQIFSTDALTRVTSIVPDFAVVLAQKFWPGPLTLVFQKGPLISDIASGGRGTIGIRIPDHPIARALLKELGSPMIATSANVSGNPAPKSAEEAIIEVGENVSVILDAGESRLGIASTVVDVSTYPPKILRAGTISAEDIKQVMGAIEEVVIG